MIFSGRANKYRKNGGELIEMVEVVLQRDRKTGLSILVVRLSATKHEIFTGVLVGKSAVRRINNKKENLEVTPFLVQKEKTEMCKIKLQVLLSFI